MLSNFGCNVAMPCKSLIQQSTVILLVEGIESLQGLETALQWRFSAVEVLHLRQVT